MKITIFPGKYHQNCGFSMAMLVYRRVNNLKITHIQTSNFWKLQPLERQSFPPRMTLCSFLSFRRPGRVEVCTSRELCQCHSMSSLWIRSWNIFLNITKFGIYIILYMFMYEKTSTIFSSKHSSQYPIGYQCLALTRWCTWFTPGEIFRDATTPTGHS